MTLVLCAHSRNTLWLLVDRRLSYGAARPPIEDAVKVTILETLDGVGLLAYAGLGATAKGTHPSEWMSAVLRGRGGLPFEQTLSFLADAARKELPRHLFRTPGGVHQIIIPAFIRGVGSRIYSIDNAVNPITREHFFRFTSHQRSVEPGSPSIHLAAAGTGGVYLERKSDKSWRRSLQRLIKANDRGRIPDLDVADALAEINMECHEKVADGSVGPRCLVVWRRRPDVVPSLPGSAHQFYTNLERDPSNPAIPNIGNGLDLRALSQIVMEDMTDRLDGRSFEEVIDIPIDTERLNQRLAELPSEPDDTLR